MKRPFRQHSSVATLPAPIRGWNARDPLSAMKAEDAVILDNWIPGTGGIALRTGFARHMTRSGTAPVESLMEYASPTGALKIFAAKGAIIVDATAGGAQPAAAVSGLANARWQHTMFGTPGGNFLVAANGADPVQNYDGSSWTQPTINNVTSSDLITVTAHVRRLWFIEKQSLRVWYLAANSISGDAASIDFGPLCKLGGSLLTMASWSRDGGDGPDDVAVFITDKGEVLVYSGVDPSSVDTWQLVGIFRIAEPIGRRCTTKAGADLGVLTSLGAQPLSEVLPTALTEGATKSFTDRIKGAFQKAYKASGALFGWQAFEYPKGALMIVNVPQQGGSSFVQFVMNTMTGAWCRFTGIPAVCWSLLGDDIYFGGADGHVYRFDRDYLDDGVPVTGDCLPAFQAFKVPSFKRFIMARPLFTAARGSTPPLVLRVDYDVSPVTLSQASIPNAGSPWDTSPWDISPWGPPIVSVANWQSISGLGKVASIRLKTASRTPITLHQIDVLYEKGGVF